MWSCTCCTALAPGCSAVLLLGLLLGVRGLCAPKLGFRTTGVRVLLPSSPGKVVQANPPFGDKLRHLLKGYMLSWAGGLTAALPPGSCLVGTSGDIPACNRGIVSGIRPVKATCWVRSLVRLPEALPAYSTACSANAADFLVSAPPSVHGRSSPSCRPCPSHDLPGVALPRPTWR